MAAGVVLCAGAALFYENGYRRTSVRISVGCVAVIALIFPAARLPEWAPLFAGVFIVCYFLVPALAVGGLLNTSRPLPERLVHCAMILTCFFLGSLLLLSRIGPV